VPKYSSLEGWTQHRATETLHFLRWSNETRYRYARPPPKGVRHRGDQLTFAQIALSDQPPQHVGAVVAVGRPVEGLLAEEMSVSSRGVTVEGVRRAYVITIGVGNGGGGHFDSQNEMRAVRPNGANSAEQWPSATDDNSGRALDLHRLGRCLETTGRRSTKIDDARKQADTARAPNGRHYNAAPRADRIITTRLQLLLSADCWPVWPLGVFKKSPSTDVKNPENPGRVLCSSVSTGYSVLSSTYPWGGCGRKRESRGLDSLRRSQQDDLWDLRKSELFLDGWRGRKCEGSSNKSTLHAHCNWFKLTVHINISSSGLYLLIMVQSSDCPR